MIDLRSDTVTKPTQGMLDAVLSASVGDDVFVKDINVDVEDSNSATPKSYKLLQNYPNPINPQTTIEY